MYSLGQNVTKLGVQNFFFLLASLAALFCTPIFIAVALSVIVMVSRVLYFAP